MTREDLLQGDLTLFKLALDQWENAFAILDLDGNYLYVNPAWERVRGNTWQEVHGRNVLAYFPDSKAMEALREERTIVAHPVIGNDGLQHYTTYTPLYREGRLVGITLQTVFRGYHEAVEFSHTLNKMQNERNFYRQELRRLRGAKYSLDNIIGESRQVVELKRQIKQAARSSSSVLLEGETGTGKELVAHSLHDLSPRAMDPFVKINCAAIPEDLAESELFGYEYGAFTGARRGGKQGKFEMASGGSLFMDEINNLSMTLQPKLLRVLQEQEVERVGGSGSIPVDVRMIAATNVPLSRMMEERSFRSDLFYRLNVINIRIPPLRERLDDLPMLAQHIIRQLNAQLGMHVDGISQDAVRRLCQHDWPGNIRELQSVLERAMNTRLHGTLLWADFASSELFFGHSRRLAVNGSYRDVRDRTEAAVLKDALETCGGNKKRAAEQLGISRTLLYRKLNKYHIGFGDTP